MSLPSIQAVSPPPDGGYTGGNTAEGTDALFSLTNGVSNTALGTQALNRNTTGVTNTATGFQALLFNRTANDNTADGMQALYSNVAGELNTATGYRALYQNNNGAHNTADGAYALNNNHSGDANTAIGYSALFSNVGSANTAVGYQALSSNTKEGWNTAIGYQALYKNTGSTGTGFFNTATGAQALYSNTTGSHNTVNGAAALSNNTTFSDNVVVDDFALDNNTSGSRNIAIGEFAGQDLDTGDDNIDTGSQGFPSESRTIRIGAQGLHTATYIDGISGVAVAGDPVVVDLNGHLGVATSSKRFKDEIKPMGNASESVLALKPVTFRYKNGLDPKRITRFGLVAKEVQKVNPDLVACDEKGQVYTVRYDAVNAMLLNEFLKEHRTVQELKSIVAKQETNAMQQQKEIDALTAAVQKVSAQLELNKAAPQTVLNNK